MICAKNYEILSKFVKVMPRTLWPLFPDTVYINKRNTFIHYYCNLNSEGKTTDTELVTHKSIQM